MLDRSAKIVARHKRTFAVLAFLVLYSVGVSFANPPTTKYQPGATLDPACAPLSTNCSVQILPDQTSQTGRLLITDGTTTSWSSDLTYTAAGFTVTTAGAGITFTGTGNHDIVASSGTLRIGSNTIIGNIEAIDSTVDIGTAATRFDKIYANEVNASTIVGTLTGGNLIAETFAINSDNATADTEDAFLAFHRGLSSPNGVLGWDATNDEFDLNSSLHITGTIANTTGLTLDGFTNDIVTGTNQHLALMPNGTGNVGVGDNTPAALFTVGSGDLFQVNSSGAIAAVTGITTTGAYTQSGSGANTFTGTSTFSSGVTLSFTPTTSAGTYTILTRNSSTGVVESIASTTMPSGSGTSGYVARWTGTNTVGTGALQDDGTNVGVGMTPTVKLQVSNGQLKTNASLTEFVRLGSNEGAASTGLKMALSGNTTVATSYFSMQLGDNATNGGTLVLQGFGGEVNIGSTTDAGAYALQVTGNIYTTGGHIQTGTTANTFTGATTLSTTNVGLMVNSTNSNAYKIAFQNAAATVGYIGATASNIFSVADSTATERFYVTTAGAGTFSSVVTGASFTLSGTTDSLGQGKFLYRTAEGAVLTTKAGSSYDFSLYSPISSEFVMTVTPSTNDMRLWGNVGIGQDPNASYMLGVTGNSKITGTLEVTGNTTISGTISAPHSGTQSERFGSGSSATGTESLAVGFEATSNFLAATSLGYRTTVTGSSGTALGANTNVAAFGVGVGGDADVTATGGISIGYSTLTSATYGGAIGYNSTSAFSYAYALGYEAVTTATNQLMVGNATQIMNIVTHGDITMPATKRFYLDGGSNTYIQESSADVISIVNGGTARAVLGGATFTGIDVTGDSRVLGSLTLYRSASTDTAIRFMNSTNDQGYVEYSGTTMKIWTNNTVRATLGGATYTGIDVVGASRISSTLLLNGALTISPGTDDIATFTGTTGPYTTWKAGATTRGYIGTGNNLITGGAATEFGMRSEGALLLAANGDSRKVTIGGATYTGIDVTGDSRITGAVTFVGSGLTITSATAGGYGSLRLGSDGSGNNQWLVGANTDAADGKFTIRDTASNTPSFVINTSRQVGVGIASSLGGRVHIVPAAAELGLVIGSSDNTSVQIETRAQGGNPTFQVSAGGYVFAGLGGAGAPTYAFYSDTNSGMRTLGADSISLVTGGSDRLRIDSAGEVAIGTGADADYLLDVGSSSVSGIVARFENSTGTCDINPTTSTLSCSSDMRLKKNITTLDGEDFELKDNYDGVTILEKILSLSPVTYNWNPESSGAAPHIGFIAQELEAVFPKVVSTDPETGLKSVGYTSLIPYTIKAIQEMNVRIESLPEFEDQTLTVKIAEFLRAIAEEGIAIVDGVKSKKVQTEELCVGTEGDEVCITKDQLQELLLGSSSGSPGGSSAPQDSTPEEEPAAETPAEEPVTEEPAAEEPIAEEPASETPEEAPAEEPATPTPTE